MYTNKIKNILTIVVLMVVLPSMSYAQAPSCKDREKAMRYLETVRGEEVVFRGISARGHVTLVHFNNNNGEWTASIIRAQNPMLLCGVDNGTSGEIVADGKGSTLKKKLKAW